MVKNIFLRLLLPYMPQYFIKCSLWYAIGLQWPQNGHPCIGHVLLNWKCMWDFKLSKGVDMDCSFLISYCM
jgi:hypothetical protein